MRLTTKGRFAVTAMVDLAMRQTRGPVTLAAISERQHISLSYLEQLFGKLRRAKLVSSVRGPGGGYTLAQPAQAERFAAYAVVQEKDDPYAKAIQKLVEHSQELEKALAALNEKLASVEKDQQREQLRAVK